MVNNDERLIKISLINTKLLIRNMASYIETLSLEAK